MRITRLINKGISQADAYKKIIRDNKTPTYRHYEAEYGTWTALFEAKRPTDCELRGSSLDAWLIASQYYRSWNQLFGINLINYFNDYKNKKILIIELQILKWLTPDVRNNCGLCFCLPSRCSKDLQIIASTES